MVDFLPGSLDEQIAKGYGHDAPAPTINLETVETGKKCVKCGGEIVIRNSHRFPYDLVIECKNCKKRYKVPQSLHKEKLEQ